MPKSLAEPGRSQRVKRLRGRFAVGSAVPEPSTWAMLLIGFAGLGFMASRMNTTRRLAAAIPF
ncbi:PEP-CTERM sorting domain-containing protein [Bradyrhizobium sp.]|uniref:PEP-CTERM sorting domain-containing protein n=1 Tax=Bradyrhizobium sp. TaxID=376 RepID=UPI003C72A988